MNYLVTGLPKRACIVCLTLVTLAILLFGSLSCAKPAVGLPEIQVTYPNTPLTIADNSTIPANPAPEQQQKPDRSFVVIHDDIGSRDPKMPSCEYYISVQNKHSTWSLTNVAVDINGTIYNIADRIAPNSTAAFRKSGLPCPQSSYHVFYQWEAPGK